MKNFVLAWLAFVALLFAGGTDAYSQAITPTSQTPLFNGTSLSGLYPWFSTSGFSDPNQIFRVENGLLRVTGNAWGALTTNNRYRNYVMVLEFKWGDETFGSRLGLAKDAGIVFHSNGAEGSWSGLLMPGIQAQMIDGGIGDVILLKGAAPMSVTSRVEQVASGINPPNWNYRGGYRWKAGNGQVTFNQDVASVHWSGWDPSWQDVIGYRGQNVLESPDGQWNQMVVVANNDTFEIYLNGTKINEGTSVVPSEGKIQLEVEFAEFFVRRWELWPLGHTVGPIITMEQLPSGTTGTAYSQTVRAAGGSALTWSIPTGSLPPGVTLNPATGQISGTPTASGTFGFTVRVTDASGAQANQPFQVAIAAPTAGLVTNGLVLHLDATQGVTATGNTVTAWADSSGNGNNVVAVSDPRRGTVLTPTGLQSIRLDGVNDVLQRTGTLTSFPSGNANRTMFLVTKYNSSTWWAGIAYGTAGSNQSFGLNVKHPSGELVLHGYGGGNDLVSTTPGIGAGWLVQSAMLNNGTATHFKDGTQIGQFAHTYNTGLTKLVIGAEIGNAGFVGMDVAAVLLYNRALSASERADVEAYLRSKFLVDTTPPVITVPANITTEATGAGGAVVNFTTSAVDNGGSVPTTNTPASGSVFPLGVTTVTTTAVDGSGNSALSTFTVTVRDTTAPVITVPNPGPINHQLGTPFADPGATATDAVAGVVPLTSSTSVNSSVAGVYILTYNFTDAAGNAAAQVTVTVNVGDFTGPVITVPGNIVVEATGSGGAVVTFSTSAMDAISGSAPTTNTPASGSMFPLGITTVTTTAVDAAGNASSATFTVTVRDTTAPVITVPNPGPLTHEAGTPFADPGATATDAVAGVVARTSSTGVNGFVPGVYVLTYNFTDAAGNAAAQVTVTVNVVDTTPPVITVPADIIAEATGSTGATVTFSTSASDLVGGSRPTTNVPASGSVFPLGVTTVTTTSADAAGNSASRTFTVTVRDTTPPVITVPADFTVEVPDANGGIVNFTTTATDTVSGAVATTDSPASGSIFSVGATTVTTTAVDAAGNTASRTFTVTAVYVPPPITPQTVIPLFSGNSAPLLYTWTPALGIHPATERFTVQNGILHVVGNEGGPLLSTDRYRDYVMVVEYKWGPRQWGAAQGRAKNSGLLLHSRGHEGGHENLNMPGLEVQFAEGSVGDFLLEMGTDEFDQLLPMSMSGTVGQVTCSGTPWNCRGGYRWVENGTPIYLDQIYNTIHWYAWSPSWQDVPGYRGPVDHESPDGQWNQVVVRVQGGQIGVHLNGTKVNEILDCFPSQGKVQLEVEGSEFFVRRWELRPLGSMVGPSLRKDSLPGGTVNAPYSQQISAAAGNGTLSWSISAGILPDGLSLNVQSGVLSGTAFEAGSFIFTATVTDSLGLTASQQYQVVINPVSTTIPVTTGLVLHLDSTQGVTKTGNTVTAWADSSGNGNNVVAVSNPQHGTVLTPLGLPAIRLDGVDDKLQRTATLTGFPSGNTNRTMFLVTKYNSSTWWAGVAFGTAASNQAFGLNVKHPSGELVLQGYAGGNDLVSTTPGIGAGWMIQSALLNGTTASHFKDGTQIGQWAHTYNTVLSKLVIGAEIGNLGFAGMDVAAVILYNRALSASERADVEAYLRSKYLVDTTPPVVTVPANITTEATGSGGAVVNFSTSALDVISGVLTPINTPASGSLFPLGMTTVTATAVDAAGNSSSRTFTVTVRDTTPPAITVPATVTVEATGATGATVNFTTAATDIVSGSVSTVDSPAAGSLFPIGTTIVTTSAVDAAGNPASQTFSVIVRDTTAPVIAVPNPGPLIHEAGTAFVDPGATATDAVAGVVPLMSSTPVNGLVPGSYLLTYNFTDAALNAAAQVTVLVNVVDTTAPVVSVPADMVVEATGASGAVVNFTTSATDIVSGSVTTVNTPASGSIFPLGATTVTVTATDAAGNAANRTFTITVRDTTAPVISVPNPGPLTHEAGAPFVDPGATATDAVAGVVAVTSSTAVNGLVPGSYVLTYDFTDAALNAAVRVTVTVNVVDTVGPVITVPADLVVEATGPGGAVANFSTTATDLISGAAATTNTPASGSLFGIGVTTVTATAMDALGNSASATFTVTVRDTTAPVITVPHPGPLSHEAGTPFADPGATASDAVAGIVPLTSSTLVNGLVPGSYVLPYQFSDAALNAATPVTVTVNVVDTTAPAISVPPDMTVEAAGPGGAVVNFTTSATDIVSGSVPTADVPAAGSLFPLGTTTVTTTAMDAFGNSASRTFTVTVRDTTAPAITVPANIVAEATGLDGATVTFTTSATDLVSGSAATVDSPASGSVFPLGTTTVTTTAMDAAGNIATRTFTVTIEDTTAPVITVPANITVEATGGDGATVSFTTSATDIVSGSVVTINSPASGSLFLIGTTTVTATAVDTAGNSSSRTFTVTVRDTTAPVVSVPADLIVEATGASGAVVNFTTSATDIVSGSVTTVNTPASGSIFPLGMTAVTATATDGAGNAANRTFTITVRDTTAPVISVPNPGPLTHEAGAPFVDPGATATDAVAGVVAVTSSTAVNGLVPGSYVLTYDFTDAALIAAVRVTVTVNVVDTMGPVIAVPANLVVEATSPGGAVANFSTTATDLISGAAATTNTPASGSLFGIGVTTVTATAMDALGNPASATFTVTVRDTTAPVITVPHPGPLSHEAGTPFADPGATASDAVAGIVPLTSSTFVNGLVPGSYVLTYQFSDAALNAATPVTVTVNVVDTTTVVPGVISYQGRISAGGVNFEGAGLFKFAMVNSAGTATYWSNDGSSIAGSQPATAVPLDVVNGLYSLRLGDTALPNMRFIPATAFGSPDVCLRIWFNDGTNGWQQLSPDQQISAAGYAMRANSATGVDDGGITTQSFAAGAVLANLNASGQSGVPSGGVVLSINENPALESQGFIKVGVAIPDGAWQVRAWHNHQDETFGASPAARYFHTAVWAGTHMIVWGGKNDGAYFNDGGRYDPIAKGWTPTAAPGAPEARYLHTAVWTGSEMIVWGGLNPAGMPGDVARYNPVSNTWSIGSNTNAPVGRIFHTAVWTGTEMVVWGGADCDGNALDTGARYNPVTDTWTPISGVNAPAPRRSHTAVWTGAEMLVWGGTAPPLRHGDGKRYNPVSDTWTDVATAGGPAARSHHTAVWTGSKMIIWGGHDDSSYFTDVRLYEPGLNTWTTGASNGAPAGRDFHTAVWEDDEMLIWGGFGEGGPVNSGARYKPSEDIWISADQGGVPSARWLQSVVWTGTDTIVFGGLGGSTGPVLRDLEIYGLLRTVLLYQRQ